MYSFFADSNIFIFVFVFNSDNWKEFIMTVVVDLLKTSNPNCFIVTGRPRTPRDQGSLESTNKVVQQVLKCISLENGLQFIEVNWTKFLGQVMAVCNSHSGIRKSSVSNYKAVIGQKYHPQLRCNMSEMQECKLIFQRLKLSPNERLETYVRQHDIVDIEIDDTEFNEDNDDNPYESDNEGEDMDENAFPELHLEQGDYNAGGFDGTLAVVASTKSAVTAAVVVMEASVPTTSGGGRGNGSGGGGCGGGGSDGRSGSEQQRKSGGVDYGGGSCSGRGDVGGNGSWGRGNSCRQTSS
jgi:hypothetical protein